MIDYAIDNNIIIYTYLYKTGIYFFHLHLKIITEFNLGGISGCNGPRQPACEAFDRES